MKKYEPAIADVVVSEAGHDEGRIYAVTALAGEFCLVADGRYRKTDNPKTKRNKHLRKIGELPEAVRGRVSGMTDAELTAELKRFGNR